MSVTGSLALPLYVGWCGAVPSNTVGMGVTCPVCAMKRNRH